MLDWTTRDCRFFHRRITRHTRLYTEMVTTGALLHGDVPRHLDFDGDEHPLALQLGGSEPDDLAHAARLAQRWGFDEVNLNCGCPSERVQRGAFGACLMREPQLVADGLKAMQDAVSLPITVKHRIGIDRDENYALLCDFIGSLALVGCRVFIVHARNAWLKGLSPKENREIPPLRYEWVHQIKRDFPQLTIVLNGGITSSAQIEEHLQHVDGVMVGRGAYHEPMVMADWDARFWGDASREAPSRDAIEAQMVEYMRKRLAEGVPWATVARHMLGLRHGQVGSRHWRQVWSDHRLKHEDPGRVSALASG